MMGARLRRFSPARALAAGWVAGVAIFLVFPTAIVALTALGGEPYVVFPPRSFTLRHFAEIPGVYLDVFATSLELALVASVVSTVLAVPAALALVRGRLVGRGLVAAVLNAPLHVPWLVVGVAFLQFYAAIFDAAGVALGGTFLGLALAHVAVTAPYVLTSVTARLASFDERLEEAAYGLGAGRIRTFFVITLPIVKPAVLAGAFFAFVVSFDNVGVSLFIFGASNTPLPVQIYGEITQHLTHVMYAVSTATAVFSVLLTLAFAGFGGMRAITGQEG
ncbi:MAG TPA: ABC transporter permease [Methylomirabilota bacterium]|jgi:putative spermidine/putrescine transport system permease protein